MTFPICSLSLFTDESGNVVVFASPTWEKIKLPKLEDKVSGLIGKEVIFLRSVNGNEVIEGGFEVICEDPFLMDAINKALKS